MQNQFSFVTPCLNCVWKTESNHTVHFCIFFFVFPNLSTYTKHSLRLWRYSLLMSLYHLPSFTAYLDHLFPQIIILWDSLKIHITVWNYLASFTYELWRYQGDPPSLCLYLVLSLGPLYINSENYTWNSLKNYSS